MVFLRLTFRQKLLVSFFLFSILPLLIGGFVISNSIREIYRDAVQESFSQAIGLREELLRRYLDSVVALLRSIAAQDLLLAEISTAVSGQSFDDDQVFVTLVSLRRENPFVEKVFIVDGRGRVIVSTASDEEGQSFANLEYVMRPLRDRQVSTGSVITSTFGKRIIPAATPLIRKSDNAVIGVLVVEINAAALSAEFEPAAGLGTLSGAAVYAVDEDGYVVAKSQGLSFSDQIWTYPVRKCQRENENVTGSWEGGQGTEVFGVSRCVSYDTLRVTLIAEEPVETAFAVSRQASYLVLIIAGIATTLLSIAIIWVARSVTRPIATLRSGARELGKGNFDFSISVTSRDELAELAADFDRARLKLKGLREQEAKLTQMKSEFLSIAAHQLRTPLTGIKWSLEDLLSHTNGLPPEKLTDLKRSVRSVNELITLVNDLLNVNRIEDGRMEYVFETGDIYAFMKDIAESVWMRHKEKNVTLTIAPAPPNLKRVHFDREKLSIVITNIVDNAVKYTPDRGQVTVTTIAGPSSVVIEVADTGIGIPPSEMKHLFSKFFRAKNALSVQATGSGLGLFVAREIARGHGGDISVDSKEGQGTRMRIRLPLEGEGPVPAVAPIPLP